MTKAQPENSADGRKVMVVGTGYVGLTTGACLASLGHHVICADVIPEKVAMLKAGQIPIMEAGLEELVREGIAAGRLEFVLGAAGSSMSREFIFMCLPTPQGADGSADLSYVLQAAADIGPHLAPGAVVINKSTVPVGSAQLLAEALGRSDVAVASNPEFLRESSAVADFFKPDRIVIGAATPEIAAQVAELYAGVQAPKLLVDAPTAELIKYASNAFLAAKISFANSIARLSEAVGADAHDVLTGMGYDERIGKRFLLPGPGWGGSCFPKDTYALINIAQNVGYDFSLLKAVIAANDEHTEYIIAKVRQLLGGTVDGAKIAAWGLAFKAGTDDTRQSPALRILEKLAGLGATIRGYDPGVQATTAPVHVCGSALEACDGADAVLVLTEWPEFAEVELQQAGERMSHRRLLDTRNIISLPQLRKHKFSYLSLGHSSSMTSSPAS